MIRNTDQLAVNKLIIMIHNDTSYQGTMAVNEKCKPLEARSWEMENENSPFFFKP